MLVCVFLSAFARETAGAARTRSSLRPLLRVACPPLGVTLRPLLRGALRPVLREGGIFQQDSGATCREIAKSIDQQLNYPGEIKVTVVRETRSVEFAR